MIVFQRLLVAIISSFAGVAALAADSVAFVSDLKGEVAIDGARRPALLAEVAQGQKISVGKDSRVALMYTASGKEFVLAGPGEYVVKETDVAATSGAAPTARATAWRPVNDVRVQVAQSSSASVRMRSIAPPKAQPPSAFPAQGSIATLQPTFRWTAEAKARGDLMIVAAGEDKPVHVAKTLGDSYRLPVKLSPEREYVWNVNAAGNEVAMGRFRTLSTEALARIDRSRPGLGAQFSDRVMFALLLQESGATQEAREAWSALARERGDLPELEGFAR